MGLNKYLIISISILFILSITSGCIEDEDQIAFNKGIELDTAWEGVTAEETPTREPAKFMEIGFVGPDYNKISQRDDNSKLTQSRETEEQDGHPYNLYRFVANNSVQDLRIFWEGYASQPFMIEKESRVDIYFYNPRDLQWDKIISEKYSDKNKDKSVSKIILGASKYFDSDSVLYVLSIGPYGAGDSTATLATDYIALVF